MKWEVEENAEGEQKNGSKRGEDTWEKKNIHVGLRIGEGGQCGW